MVIAFADNQTLVCTHGMLTTVYTDWLPMGAADRLSVQSNVHSLVKTGVGSATLTYLAQTSNDGGQNPINTGVTGILNTTGAEQQVGLANGALVRFKFILELTASSAGDMAAVCFDLHVKMDHA